MQFKVMKIGKDYVVIKVGGDNNYYTLVEGVTVTIPPTAEEIVGLIASDKS